MSLSLTKMAVLTGYANTISLKEFAKNRLFLVTPAGMISGIPVFDFDFHVFHLLLDELNNLL